MERPTCRYCQFFYVAPQIEGVEDPNGACRRNPPKVFLLQVPNQIKRSVDMQNVTVWPIVNKDTGWCGEFLMSTSVQP